MNIYALSSGRGPSGIAIVRISGKSSLKVCKNLTQLKEIKSNEVNFCKFYDPKTKNVIDPEALLLWFPAPNSYTGDDLAEFQVHGSNAVINALLKALSEQDDCRLAEPGEFTKVAFQNDKIDLLKAESIGDLIHAETELQREQAVKLVQGNASKYYDDLREKLIKSLSYIEAKIDFAEDDLPEKVLKEIQTWVKEVHKNIDKAINIIKEKLSKKFTSNNTALITRERHRVKLQACLKEIDNFLKKDQAKEIELAAEDLRMATRHLGSIVGKVDVEEILGSIFKDFCIGK